MSGLEAIWEFVVGDDPLTALGVVLAVAATAVIAETDLAPWWLLPIAVCALLGVSVHRAARR